MTLRSPATSKRNSLFSTIRSGFNQFEEIGFRSTSVQKGRTRIKTDPSGEVVEMLKSKRDQCSEISSELRHERELQLLDFVKKSIKYQELLNINDNKRKRLPTLNSKVGQVVKVSINLSQHTSVSYALETKVLPLHYSTPPSRQGHTTIVYHNTAVVIGGHCSYPYSTAHVYSFTSKSWIKQFSVSTPRSYHSAVLYKDRYGILFGGMGAYDVSRKCRVCYSSVNIVDLHNMTTRVLKMGGEEAVEGRRSHACTVMGKYMIVFGGINTRRVFLKDFIYLDLKQLRWYQKQYSIDSRDLAQELEKGVARHKAIAHFKPNHKILPLYSSQYSDSEGLYFFGGSFGAGTDNVILFMALNTYNPCLRRISYSGTPPSSVHTLAEKINQNIVVIISGETDCRSMKVFKIMEKEFIGVYKFINNPFFGGMGSTLNKYPQGLLLLFGLSQGGYTSEVVTLSLVEQIKEQSRQDERIQKNEHLDWKIWEKMSLSQSSEDIL